MLEEVKEMLGQLTDAELALVEERVELLAGAHDESDVATDLTDS